ncbi:alpha/beta hydrolase [Aspergillus ibericus CBS 121593]|uniref:Alpha/beta-hydrolase n=1 Tax=Aspergillus ibericus CBS 121593 TaxID=1448316 RepID=A0A395GVZ6_9EURO|nr:alpha/beta-hydrolase [Aspergillus ibericus CBS 121593]RAK99751.1 alpha/beta-hydrolase [Aspergillus ibericus CBS 121593]
MTHQTPTAILIVHGGYFLPPAWDDFSARLSGAGFTVSCPRLPSCKDARPPTASLTEDVEAVRRATQDLLNAGHTILVLAHSYGGVVASEAITRDLYASENTNTNGIVSLILLSAWLVQPGDSLPGVIEKYGFQCDVELGNNGDGTVFATNAPASFYNDIEPARAEDLAKDNVTHNWAAASGAVTGAPWKDLPTLYIHATQDLAIKLPLQKSMVQDAVNAGGKIVTETVDSGHCPFLSKPEELFWIVQKAASEL